MTCREKLKLEHPELISSSNVVFGCPSHYGYLADPRDEEGHIQCRLTGCTACWDRDIDDSIVTDVKTANMLFVSDVSQSAEMSMEQWLVNNPRIRIVSVAVEDGSICVTYKEK